MLFFPSVFLKLGVVIDEKICSQVVEACGVELANLWNGKKMFVSEAVAMYDRPNNQRSEMLMAEFLKANNDRPLAVVRETHKVRYSFQACTSHQ